MRNPSGWCPTPRPTSYDCSLSSPDDLMVTPPSSYSPPPSAVSPVRQSKKRASTNCDQELSASPDLKKGRPATINMKRTPQPSLTQSKLTGMFLGSNTATQATAASAKSAQQTALDTEMTDVETPAPVIPPIAGDSTCRPVTGPPPEVPAATATAPLSVQATGGSTLVTTDFLLKALQENTNNIIKSFTSNLGALATVVESNKRQIEANKSSLEKTDRTAVSNTKQIASLDARVRALESAPAPVVTEKRATLSPEYELARRSLRAWPVCGESEQDLWGNAGDFIHELLKVPYDEVNQVDILEVRRPTDPFVPDGVVNEAVIVFKDKRIRDLVMSHSVNLAGNTDGRGKPTAGTRLELPPELRDTFRLLSRFGTRLRARHGIGTKRHVKFDDFTGSLYVNVKLPGDESWTRISPEMARVDLERSMKEEDTKNQNRLASKLLPGPRERLNLPMPVRLSVVEASISAPSTSTCSNGAVLSDTGCSGGVDGNHEIC